MDNLNKYRSPLHKKSTNKNRKKVKLKKKKLFKLFLFILAAIIFISFGVSLRSAIKIEALETTSGWVKELDEIKNNESETKEWVNSLFVCLDIDGDIDYLLITNHEKEAILLPGETYLKIPDKGRATLKDAFEWGGNSLLIETIREKIETPVHNYMRVESSLAHDLALKLGLKDEVDLTLLKPEDEEIENVLERIKSKEGLILKIKEEYAQETSLWNRSDYLDKISKNVETNLDWEEARIYLNAWTETISKENVELIPGNSEIIAGDFYWVLEHEKALEKVDEMFHINKFVEEELSPGEIKIEVLGVKDKEAAEKAGKRLEEKGFQVEKIGKETELNYSSNVVIARQTPEMAAKLVALEVEGADLLRKIKPDSEVMVTVIIGEN